MTGAFNDQMKIVGQKTEILSYYNMFIVYLTINLKSQINGNNKIYVGVHRTKDPTIFDGYIGCGVVISQPSTYMHPKTPFQYAVKKYGVNAFKRITLFEFDNAKEAYEKEKEIVNTDFLKQEHVYNISLGGICNNNGKPVYQFDLDGNLVKEWKYIIDISDFYGYDIQRFQYAIHHKHQFLDYYWSNTNTIDVAEYITSKPHSPKIAYLYSKQGKCIKQFDSHIECAKYLGLKDISKAIKDQSLVQSMYYVSDKLVDEFKPKAKAQNTNKTFYVYKDSNFIGEYKGKEIMKVIDLYSWSKVSDIFRYYQGWYKDFYISDTKVDQVPIRIHSNGFLIDIYTKFGEYIETLKSLKEVREKYKVPSARIKNIQLGDRYFNDFIFKYHRNSK